MVAAAVRLCRGDCDDCFAVVCVIVFHTQTISYMKYANTTCRRGRRLEGGEKTSSARKSGGECVEGEGNTGSERRRKGGTAGGLLSGCLRCESPGNVFICSRNCWTRIVFATNEKKKKMYAAAM